MDGGAWWAIVHGVAKSRTQLSDFNDNDEGSNGEDPGSFHWGHKSALSEWSILPHTGHARLFGMTGPAQHLHTAGPQDKSAE